MYSQSDIQEISRQFTNRILFWLVPEALLLAAVVYSAFILPEGVRREWVTSLIFALLCGTVLFSMTLYILPARHYQRFVQDILQGKPRQSIVLFEQAIDMPVVREGVRFLPVLTSVGTFKDGTGERQFYWDANIPLPEWKAGGKLVLSTHEKVIVGWELAPDSSELSG